MLAISRERSTLIVDRRTNIVFYDHSISDMHKSFHTWSYKLITSKRIQYIDLAVESSANAIVNVLKSKPKSNSELNQCMLSGISIYC